MATRATKETTIREAVPEARPMKISGKTCATVSDMIRDMGEDAFADEFDRHLTEHRLSKILTVIRCNQGMTQEELASKLKCGQGKVSKVERSADFDLNFGDIVAHLHAMGHTLHMVVAPARSTGADHVRFHVNSIKHELEKLVRLAGDDKVIGDGVEAFAIEQVQDMIVNIEKTLSKLPYRGQGQQPSLCVEVEGDRGERLPLDAPRRVRKASPKAVGSR